MSLGNVREICQWVGGEVANHADLPSDFENIGFERPAPVAHASSGDLIYFFSKGFESDLAQSSPSILITGSDFVGPIKESGHPLWKSAAVIACRDPYRAMAIISQKLCERLSSVAHRARPKKSLIHPSADIHPSVEVGDQVQVGAFCSIGEGSRIGSGVVLYPGTHIGPGVVIGDDCVLFSNVSIYEKVQIGNRCRIHSSTVIGADGFGYATIMEGKQPAGHDKIYHFGRVVIGNDVEIGAATCVDRGTVDDTVIKDFVKIDNQVQVAHNCFIDEGAVLCGKVGIAGSARIGKYVFVGGLTGINNRAVLGDFCKVGAGSLVTKIVEPGDSVSGNPQRKHRDWMRLQVIQGRLISDWTKKKGR